MPIDPQRSNAPLDVIATVTSVTPPNGPSVGGTGISLVGTGFTGASDVFFGTDDITATCPSAGGCFTFVDDSDITAETPPGSSGAVDITVTTGAGAGNANPPDDQFTYFDPPTVTNVVGGAQPQGSMGIGVAGHNFSDGSGNDGVIDVDLVPDDFSGPTIDLSTQCAGGSSPDCFTFNTDTSLSVNLPASMAAGQYDTEVVTPGGTSAQSSADFLAVDPPLSAVTLVNPDTGPNAGGAPEITITGTDFTGSSFAASDLFFHGNDVAATNAWPCSGSATGCFKVNSATSISAYPPSGSGQEDITVQTESTDGASQQTSNTSAADTFAYAPIPTVTNVTPGTGPTVGGNSVTVTGTGFESNNGPGADYTTTHVDFEGTSITTAPCSGSPSAPCFTVSSATKIVVGYAPPHVSGTVDITVTTPGGTSTTSVNDEYLYAVLPTVTGVSPNVGATAGGNTVTLTGTGFTGATDVFVESTDVGSSPCGTAPCFTVNTATSITLMLPSHSAGAFDIEVQTPGGRSAANPPNDQYTFDPVPTVTNVVPSSGPTTAGTTITVAGTAFTGATDVFVGAADVTNLCGSSNCYTVNSPTSITVILPAQAAGTVDVEVLTPGGRSVANQPNDQYTFVAAPTVTGVSPSSGPSSGGNQITVTGTLFTGATDVFVGASDVTNLCGSSNCYTVVNPTTITVKLPAQSAGPAVDVRVETIGGESAISGSDKYTFLPAPTVTSVAPDAGPTAGGISVIVTGTEFSGATDVFFGAVDITTTPCLGSPSAPCFTVNSATQIVVQDDPAHGPATVDITVATPLGTSAAAPPGDTFTWAPVPTVTNVSPNAGSTSGGIPVVVTGTGFIAGPPTSMLIGTTSCALTSCFVVNSATQITIASIPAGAGGQDDIRVTTIGGMSAANPPHDIFTYVAAFPTVTALSPSSGADEGGAVVTITGTNFGTQGSGFAPTDVIFGSTQVKTTPCPSNPTTPCFNAVDSTRISVFTPSTTTPGPVDVTVTTPAGTTDISPGDKYTYVAPSAYTALTPFRICDTRPSQTKVGCTTGRTLGTNGAVVVTITGRVVSGESVPAGAQAVVVNLTAIDHSSTKSFVTAYPTSRPVSSNINVDPLTTQANLAVVALSSTGTITVFNAVGSVDVIVDIEGYFAAPAGSAGTFHAFPPVRICDTRAKMNTVCATTANRPLAAGTWRDVVVSGLPPGGTGVGIPTDGTAASAVLNITAVGPTAATFLAVAPATGNFQCPSGHPSVSNFNPKKGETEASRAISPLGPHQDICVYNSVGSVNFIVDVNGWFGNGAELPLGAHFYAVPPTRICDTRTGMGTRCAGQPIPAAVVHVIAVAGVSVVPAFTTGTPPVAVVMNLTGVTGTATTVLQLYPSSATHRPVSSDLNLVAHDTIANLAVVSLATTGATPGDVDLYNSAGTINAILDVAGWFQ